MAEGIQADSLLSPARNSAETSSSDESIEDDDFPRRLELAHLEVAAVQVVRRQGARLLKPTLVDHSSSESHPPPQTCSIQRYQEHDIEQSPASPNSHGKGPKPNPPLHSVRAIMNRLWNSNETRSRILNRDPSRSACKEGSTTASATSSFASEKERSHSTANEDASVAKQEEAPSVLKEESNDLCMLVFPFPHPFLPLPVHRVGLSSPFSLNNPTCTPGHTWETNPAA